MKTKILALLLAAALLCGVFCACSGNTSTPNSSETETNTPTEIPQHSNEITVGIAQDLDNSLDPHLTVAAGTREVMFNVFEGLVKPNADGDLVCAVAQDYTISDDRLTYTFTLRDGMKFHNGSPVTVDDVVFSISRCADTSNGDALIPALAVIESVEAVDAQHVAIKIAEPNNEFLSNLTVAILPKDYDGQDTAPVGTGPFRFVSRKAQDSIVLERFDDYWGEKAYLDRITFKVIENADSLVLSLQSGALDFVAHLNSTQVAQLGDEFTVLEGTMNLVQALYLNNAVAPLDDVRVRQALCYAVDRQQIMDMIADGHGAAVGSSMYPAFTKYFDASLNDVYSQDIEKAKALLAEAGYPDGFEMTITVPSNYQPHMDTAQVLVEQLAAIGVRATVEPVEWASWLENVYMGRNYTSTVVGVDASAMTATAMLSRFVSDAGNNFVNFNSPDYDALYAQAKACYDDAEQTALFKQMEAILAKEAANVYIQDMADLVAIRSNLTGYRFYPIYVTDFSTVRYVD